MTNRVQGSDVVTGALHETFHASDLIGRWSGDEFVAIAMNATEPEADRITARLTQRMHDVERDHPKPTRLRLASDQLIATRTERGASTT